MIASARFLKHTAQPPRRLPPIPLPQREEHRSLTIPPNTIPNSVLIPIHDLEPGNRAMKVTENSENLSSGGFAMRPIPWHFRIVQTLQNYAPRLLYLLDLKMPVLRCELLDILDCGP